MTRKAIMLGAALACGASFLAGHVLAQEDDMGGGGMGPPAWAQLTEEHTGLAKMAGTWDVKTKMWMMPGQPPMEGTAVAKSEMIFGGRFLKETFTANFMGQPFEGQALVGYDTIKKDFVSIWIDNMSPIVYVSRGTHSDGKTTYHGEQPDYMTGNMKKTQMVVETKGDDEQVSRFFDVGADGKLTQTMEMHYTRKKE